jgi:hypothetical protein
MELHEVPACTLPTAERPLRVAEFTALFAGLTDVDRRAPGSLRLRMADRPGLAERAGDLTGRESGCCSFFAFGLTRAGGELLLDVDVPDAHVDVLDGLERLARAAR